MDRVGPFRPAIELEAVRLAARRRVRPGPGPGAYAATGVLVVIIAGQLLLAWSLEPIATWTATREHAEELELRSLSQLALTPLWRWSQPAINGGLLLVMLGLLRVRRAAAYLVLAAVAAATAILTFVWATAPF